MLTYEDCSKIVEAEVEKRKSKWYLSGFTWMEFEDAAQIIKIHIAAKWDLYDQTQKLEPWLNRTITHQIRNLIRNNYSNYAKPCVSCAASQGDELCSIYQTQCEKCPLYKKWAKARKYAFDVKLPLSTENHTEEIENKSFVSMDMEESARRLHERMKQVLLDHEWKVYDLLYIQSVSQEEVAKRLGYFTNEKNRSPGYKRISIIKKSIMAKVKKEMYSDNIDIV